MFGIGLPGRLSVFFCLSVCLFVLLFVCLFVVQVVNCAVIHQQSKVGRPCKTFFWIRLMELSAGVTHASKGNQMGKIRIQTQSKQINHLRIGVALRCYLSDPSGTDLTVVFSPPSSPPSRFKPIVNKQLHSSYFSIATHKKYRF